MRKILWAIGGIVVLLVVFGCGLLVGYRKALFSSKWGMNYYRNFYGSQTLGRMPLGGYGVSGAVLAVTTSTIAVKDTGGDEESVFVTSDTVIRDRNAAIMLSDIVTGDQVTVIGEPDAKGQIEARFIRVFDVSSSMPMMPGTSFN